MADVYSAYSSSREYQIGRRRDKTLLAKFRTGKYKGLSAYKSLLGGSDPTCPLSNQFNTGCRDAKRHRNWDLNFFGKDSGGWIVRQSSSYRQWPWRAELSLRVHNNIFISSRNLIICSFVSFIYYSILYYQIITLHSKLC